MKGTNLHKMAVRLAEGGYVEFHNLVIGAKLYSFDIDACFECNMDYLCDMEMTDLCGEVTALTRKKCMLYLPNECKYAREKI